MAFKSATELLLQDNFDFSIVEEENNAPTVSAYDTQKAANVVRFVGANPGLSILDIVAKFGLDVRMLENFGNGTAKFGFFTSISRDAICTMELRLGIKKQWPDSELENHPDNWEIAL